MSHGNPPKVFGEKRTKANKAVTAPAKVDFQEPVISDHPLWVSVGTPHRSRTARRDRSHSVPPVPRERSALRPLAIQRRADWRVRLGLERAMPRLRSEEHTSELQSL